MTESLRQTEAGFTLIEALIALAILSITAVGFLRSTEANIARVAALEARSAATWVAQNRLAERALGLPAPDGPVQMLGWDFAVTVQEVPEPDTALVRVSVTASSQDGAAMVTFSGLAMNVAGEP